MDNFLQENSFDGAPGGSAGISSVGPGYGTPAGGNVTQTPSSFSASEKGVNHIGNDASGSQHVNPDSMQPPLGPDSASLNNQVNQLFSKKVTPSPDEIMMALQYELNNMVKRDKSIAKQKVLNNLKQDPLYYSRLGMLNIDDEKMMKVNETVKLLDSMIEERSKKKNERTPQSICDIIQTKIKEKQERRYGKQTD